MTRKVYRDAAVEINGQVVDVRDVVFTDSVACGMCRGSVTNHFKIAGGRFKPDEHVCFDCLRKAVEHGEVESADRAWRARCDGKRVVVQHMSFGRESPKTSIPVTLLGFSSPGEPPQPVEAIVSELQRMPDVDREELARETAETAAAFDDAIAEAGVAEPETEPPPTQESISISGGLAADAAAHDLSVASGEYLDDLAARLGVVRLEPGDAFAEPEPDGSSAIREVTETETDDELRRRVMRALRRGLV